MCGGNNMSFDQSKYTAEYNKEKYVMIPFRVKKNNKEVLEKLKNEKASRNQYILNLIENDIKPATLKLSFIKETLINVLSKYNIHEIYLFGSYARGEAKESSDIDVYCERGNIETFLEQAKMMNELEQALGKKVDIIFTTAKLDTYFEEQMRKDLIKLC